MLGGTRPVGARSGSSRALSASDAAHRTNAPVQDELRRRGLDLSSNRARGVRPLYQSSATRAQDDFVTRPMALARSPGCRKYRPAHCAGCSLLPRAVALYCCFSSGSLCQSILAGAAASGARRRGEKLIVRLLKRRGSAQSASLPISIQRPLRRHHALACPVPVTPAARSLSQPAVA